MDADASTCTCGSGGHPRRCAKHPEEFDRHCADMDRENHDAAHLIQRERERFEKILTRHSQIAARNGRFDLARLLDRLGDAMTACGDDGEAPLELVCHRCAKNVGTVPSGVQVPHCPNCNGVLDAHPSEEL